MLYLEHTNCQYLCIIWSFIAHLLMRTVCLLRRHRGPFARHLNSAYTKIVRLVYSIWAGFSLSQVATTVGLPSFRLSFVFYGVVGVVVSFLSRRVFEGSRVFRLQNNILNSLRITCPNEIQCVGKGRHWHFRVLRKVYSQKLGVYLPLFLSNCVNVMTCFDVSDGHDHAPSACRS
jgi:hypothetical protein